MKGLLLFAIAFTCLMISIGFLFASRKEKTSGVGTYTGLLFGGIAFVTMTVTTVLTIYENKTL